ncbi:MAG: hypothetical protein JXB10_01780 [Pirellulales bacterium]|nr:hypothetical protein [Pirellulales bacterium]
MVSPTNAIGGRGFPKWFLPAVGLLAAILYAWSMLLPWAPPPPNTNLDGSWQMLMQQAPRQSWQFGKEVVFTYGPLGWLAVLQYHAIDPANYLPVLAAQAFLVFWATLAVAWISWRITPHPVGRLLAAAIAVLVYVEMGLVNREVTLVVLVWSFTLLSFFRQAAKPQTSSPGSSEDNAFSGEDPAGGKPCRWFPTLVELGLIVALGLASLYKFVFLALSLAAVGGVSAHALWQRKIPWQLPAWLGALLGLWCATGQSLSSFWPYLQNSLEISRGYASSMQLPCSDLIVGIFYLEAAAIIGGQLWAQGELPWKTAVFSAGTMALILILLLKSVLVRADFWHLTTVLYTLPLLTLLSCCAFWPGTWPRRRMAPLGMALALMASFTVLYELHTRSRTHFSYLGVAERRHQVQAALKVLGGGADYARTYRETMDRAGETLRHTPRNLTVDLYPFETGLVMAAGCRYRPRPVIQSYKAYTPRLAALNARHLRSNRAADLVYFQVQAIDGQFPPLSDGPSWPELFTRYDLHPTLDPAECGGYLPLLRAKNPRSWKLELLAEREVPHEQSVDVPDAAQGPIWAEILFRPNWPGTLTTLLCREPTMELRVERGPDSRQYRLIRGMAEAGFLLSPVVEEPIQFAWVASTPWSDPAWRRFLSRQSVRRITLLPHGKSAFQVPVRIRFYRLHFEPWINKRLAFPADNLALGGAGRASAGKHHPPGTSAGAKLLVLHGPIEE